ncbi:MAG: glycosyltransferase [Pseudomonadales bacterium]|nr:glycosyltransferase [Pseudomonadales bacterium]
MMLYKFLSASSVENIVISLNGTRSAPMAEKIESLDVNIYYLGMRSNRIKLENILDLWRIIKIESPDVVQGWMYHGNMMALLATRLKPNIPVLWNIRHSLHDLSEEKRVMRLLIRLNAFFSKTPVNILYNSSVTARQHERYGLKESKTKIIPNGFDSNKFSPNADIRRDIRKKYNVKENQCLFAMVARYHPVKGHSVLLNALSILIKRNRNLKVMLVGKGLESTNHSLVELINQCGLSDFVLLLGEREDIPQLMSSFDVLVSASWGEAFPNCVGEAMLSGVPCIVADVGDSKWIVGDWGKVVKPGDVEGLSNACSEYMVMDTGVRQTIGRHARDRIKSHFGLDKIAQQYDFLYQTVENGTHSKSCG